jgi:MFS family permease
VIIPTARRERFQLSTLLFMHAHAQGLWNVAFATVLEAHGLVGLVPYAFACGSIAAFISPLAIGTLADKHIPANRLLRWLAVATSVCLAVTFIAIDRGWGALAVLAMLQVQAVFSAPLWGLTSSIVLARMRSPETEFGPVRVWATVGWMSAGWVTSFVLMADTSVRSGFAASAMWLVIAAFTLTLPDVPPLGGGEKRTWRDLFGTQALALLAHRDHRIVFGTIALFSIPLAAFFPFTTLHLLDAGLPHVAATMSLGQVTEILALVGLGAVLARLRLKWIFLAGMGFGFVRYVLFALNTKAALISGIALHGLCFTLFFITAQIYLEKRVEPALRARAQSLMTLMTAGVGTLIGSLGCGWWRLACRTDAGTDWPRFWLVLAAFIAAVFVFFAVAYRGRAGGGLEDDPA